MHIEELQLEILQVMKRKFPDTFVELANRKSARGNACLCAATRQYIFLSPPPPLPLLSSLLVSVINFINNSNCENGMASLYTCFPIFKWLVENGVNGLEEANGTCAIHHSAKWVCFFFVFLDLRPSLLAISCHPLLTSLFLIPTP